MDAFFASVEVLDRPELAGKPVVVGGVGRRGVVASASYEARVFGVRSAMPSTQARRLCPHAVFLAGRYERYQQVSAKVHSIFESYTPLVEGVALDEAFLDVTGSVRLFGSAEQMAWQIRHRICQELGLGASVGVAGAKFLAKLASEAAKPRLVGGAAVPGAGVFVVPEGQELDFLHRHPVRALWGVGSVTETRLARLGVHTVGQLAHLPRQALVGALGESAATGLASLAWGQDPSPVRPTRPTKSIGHEQTYPEDLRRPAEVRAEAGRLAIAVSWRLQKAGLEAQTLTLKVRFGDFRTLSRSKTLPVPTADQAEVARVALGLLEGLDLRMGVRLMGLAASKLGPPRAPLDQLSLDLQATNPSGLVDPQRRARVSAASRAVKERFGAESLVPGAALEASRRHSGSRWGPQPSQRVLPGEDS